jgi:protoheme ferro-lyase
MHCICCCDGYTGTYMNLRHYTAGAVKPLQFHLSFQSRVGPVKWIGPYTDFKIRELAQEKKVLHILFCA